MTFSSQSPLRPSVSKAVEWHSCGYSSSIITIIGNSSILPSFVIGENERKCIIILYRTYVSQFITHRQLFRMPSGCFSCRIIETIQDVTCIDIPKLSEALFRIWSSSLNFSWIYEVFEELYCCYSACMQLQCKPLPIRLCPDWESIDANRRIRQDLSSRSSFHYTHMTLRKKSRKRRKNS